MREFESQVNESSNFFFLSITIVRRAGDRSRLWAQAITIGRVVTEPWPRTCADAIVNTPVTVAWRNASVRACRLSCVLALKSDRGWEHWARQYGPTGYRLPWTPPAPTETHSTIPSDSGGCALRIPATWKVTSHFTASRAWATGAFPPVNPSHTAANCQRLAARQSHAFVGRLAACRLYQAAAQRTFTWPGRVTSQHSSRR